MRALNPLSMGFYTLLLSLCTVAGTAQNSKLIVLPSIQLPNDSTESANLLRSLETFLLEKNSDLYTSKVVELTHYSRYKDFFDVFKNIERSKKYNDTSFFKPYLTNVVLQPDQSYLISLTYSGITPENKVVLRLAASLIAKKTQNQFKLYCPFEGNTKYWNTQKVGNIQFFYEGVLNVKIARDFDAYNTLLARKLKIKPLQFSYYKCRDIQQVNQLMGIEYDLTINGTVRSGVFDAKNKLFVSGTNSEQYKHDLTHGYFDLLLVDSLRNWTAEEGYNVYSTDYWGESSTQVLKYLNDYATNNPNKSLLEVFEQNITLKSPIPIKYPIAAVIMRKIEKAYGFEKVLALISCGDSDDQFFEALQKIAGITKDSFDREVRNELKKYEGAPR